MTKAILPLLIAAGALLAGCGKIGNLEQPAPLWGEKAKAEFKARTAAGETSGYIPPAPPPNTLQAPEPGAATPVPVPATAIPTPPPSPLPR